MTLYLNKLTADGIVTNKSFWKFIKPFLKSKCCYEQNNIMLIQNDQIITEEKDLVETFTLHYIDIVEKSSGIIVIRTYSLETRAVLIEIFMFC